MQAINLEAKLEAKLRAVLFAGTAFAIFGQKRPIQEKKSLQTVKIFSIMENRVCVIK